MPHRIPTDWVLVQGPDPWLCASGCNHVGAVDIFPNIARCGNCAAEWAPKEPVMPEPLVTPKEVAAIRRKFGIRPFGALSVNVSWDEALTALEALCATVDALRVGLLRCGMHLYSACIKDHCCSCGLDALLAESKEGGSHESD